MQKQNISQKNDYIYSFLLYISNSVNILIISLFITLFVSKNIKWFYIILFLFIIGTIIVIFKVITIPFTFPFLKRPGDCSEDNILVNIFTNNFITQEMKKSVSVEEYAKRGFPSFHLTFATSIFTLIYYYFPKYRKFIFCIAPIYLILLAYSRIYLDCHSLLQVIAGFFTGIILPSLLFKIFN